MYELSLDATIENLDEVLAFVDQHLEEADCSMKVQMQIDVAVEEIFVNIAHYAYKPEIGRALVQLDFEPGNVVAITFVDSGIPYDPLAKADPDVTLSAEERQIGGLGIYMVKKSMDEMLYAREDGKNILVLKKKLF